MSGGALPLVFDGWLAKRGGAPAVTARQRARLAEAVAFARAHSPFYRELYRGVPERIEDASELPPIDKRALMAGFDEWATDRAVTLEGVRAFAGDASLVGERYLGRYTVATTSGTTGTQGVFLIDDRSLAVASAMSVRMLGAWLDMGDVVRVVRRGVRMAMVNATGGHFASAIAAERLTRRHPCRVRLFSVGMPLADMVAGLNDFRPALVASYAGMAALLAGEREAGRLRIDPALLVLSAEGLPPGEYERIARVFAAKVRDSYAATECPFLSYRCGEGWLHVNADWVVLEPVDADHRPVPPGERSHTVLVSNLANRVQPILRYDLGDSVLTRPDPCPCGDPLPAIRVQGRAADVLTIPGPGGPVAVAPLLLSTIVDRVPGVELIQLVQTEPATLRVRLRLASSAEPERSWNAVRSDLAALLAERGLSDVAVERANEAPEQSAGGKFRQVVPLRTGT